MATKKRPVMLLLDGARTSKTSNSTDVLEASVPGREGTVESATRLRLNAPGQRGILQSVNDVKKNATKLLPKYSETMKTAQVALKRNRTQRQAREQLMSSLQKAKQYVDTLQVLDIKDVRQLDKHAKTLTLLASVLQKAQESGEELMAPSAEDDNKLRESLQGVAALSREFQGELERINTTAASWMDVKWTADNATAVGRGPPGHLAYSPFVQYKIPYDVADVRKVIEESNKRVR